MKRLLVSSFVVFVLTGPATATEASDPRRVVSPLLQTCLSKGREILSGDKARVPRAVTEECSAAAIAERAFRKHVPSELKYSIWPMDHTKTHWYFMMMGETHGPPAPGEHWMVIVNRKTGRTKIVDGA